MSQGPGLDNMVMPPPTAGFAFFGGAQWDWLSNAVYQDWLQGHAILARQQLMLNQLQAVNDSLAQAQADAAQRNMAIQASLGQLAQTLATLDTASILTNTETIMATIQDIQALAQQYSDDEHQLAQEVTAFTGALSAFVTAYTTAKNNPGTTFSAQDQAALDQAAQQMTDASQDLLTQTQSLTGAEATIPPTP